MEKELIELAEKAEVFLTPKGQLATRLKNQLSRQDIETLRANKYEIIEWLKEKRERKIKEEEEENKKEYADLIAKLPERNFKNTPDPKKFAEIMAKISNRHYSGTEDDGLNLSVSAHNFRVRKEAQKYCDHEIKISWNFTYTADARKMVDKIYSCEKCGLYLVDSVSEEISDDAIWR